MLILVPPWQWPNSQSLDGFRMRIRQFVHLRIRRQKCQNVSQPQFCILTWRIWKPKFVNAFVVKESVHGNDNGPSKKRSSLISTTANISVNFGNFYCRLRSQMTTLLIKEDQMLQTRLGCWHNHNNHSDDIYSNEATSLLYGTAGLHLYVNFLHSLPVSPHLMLLLISWL